MEQVERWQQPYRAAVDELERREREWRQTDELLRRISGRLCIAARGLDAPLDSVLGNVITTLRSPAPAQALEPLLDRLTKQVAALDRPPSVAVEPAAAPAPMPVDARLARNLSRILVQLGDLPELTERAKALEARLTQVERPDSLAELAIGVADLAQAQIANLQRTRQETDRLLVQFSERLEDIARYLKGETDEQRSAQSEQLAFGQQLLSETEALVSQTRAATDLGDLQQQVYRRLTAIDQRVRHHREREETRARAYQQRTEALYERIESLENQTQVLTRSLNKLERRATTDGLTRVANRAAYDQRIKTELQQYQRDQRPRCLVAIDIDHFKSINDRYGHQAGDKVLQIVAQHWSRRLREADFFARYGGEEFAMLLDNATDQQGLLLSNRLREGIGQLAFHFNQQPVTITVSCGITAFRDKDTPQSLFERADRALYEAKRNGRNRCCIEL